MNLDISVNIVAFPILIPFVAFVFSLILLKNIFWQKIVTLFASCCHLLTILMLFLLLNDHGSLSLQAAGWEALFGISLLVDPFAWLMVGVTSIMYFVTCLYSVPKRTCEDSAMYFPLLNSIIGGISGVFLTADLFNLYVWFEVVLLSSFALLTLQGGRERLKGGFIYAIISLTGSMIFLAAAGLTYGAVSTLNMAELSQRLTAMSLDSPFYVLCLSLLFLLAFALKSAMWPFYFWLPESYHLPSPALSALFAALLTKVGIYAIFRLLIAVFPISTYLVEVIAILAGMIMILGVLGAVAQYQARLILTFHSISQIGYIAAGAVFVTAVDPGLREFGLAAGIFFMVQYIFVKAALFFVSGIIGSREGSEELKHLGSVETSAPWLGFFFAVSAMSLAGIPPFSGFWAKFIIVRATITGEYYFLALAMVITGFFTIFSMIKIWNEAFWKPKPEILPHSVQGDQPQSNLGSCFIALTIVTAITVGIGLFPAVLFKWSEQAASGLLQQYEHLPTESALLPTGSESTMMGWEP